MEPIIKVRYKEKILWTLLLIVHGTLGQISRCDKTPEDYKRVEKTPGSHGFSVSVSGSPRKYRPEQVYTIKLSVSIRFSHTFVCLKNIRNLREITTKSNHFHYLNNHSIINSVWLN